MDKGKKVVLLIIIISIIILGVVSFFMYKYFSEKVEVEEKFNVFKHFVVKDKISGNLTNGHYYYYMITNETKEFIKQGDYTGGMNEANLTISKEAISLLIYTLKDGYYKGMLKSNVEKDNLEISIYPFPKNISDIQIKKINLSKDQTDNINISISTNYYIEEPMLCFAWSLGIITIRGQEADIPNFLSKKVDNCFKIATINQETRGFVFEIQTGILNDKDYLDVYIVDSCKLQENNFEEYIHEKDGQDVCMETFKYKVY